MARCDCKMYGAYNHKSRADNEKYYKNTMVLRVEFLIFCMKLII